MLTDLIINKLKEIIKFQIKTDDIYQSKQKNLQFYWIIFTYCFLRHMHQGYIIKDADDVQKKFANKLKNIDNGIKSVAKRYF